MRNILLFILMGASYYEIEVLFDGTSHWSMFLLGGICGMLIGLLNEKKLTWTMPLWKQVLYGELIVLPLEFITGVFVNLIFKWDVWNYSELPFSLYGQTSLLFAFLFIPVILLAIFVDDYYRWIFMNGKKPTYKLM